MAKRNKSGLFKTDSPERSAQTAAWCCSLQVLQWLVLDQEAVGWAALPGCGLSQHLVMLAKPRCGKIKHCYTYITSKKCLFLICLAA